MTRQQRPSGLNSRTVSSTVASTASRLGRSCMALLGLLSLGGVVAQSVPAPAGSAADSAALCAVPDALLQVTVGGQTRGDFLVKVAPAGLLLEGGALQASEAKYGSARFSCDGLEYVLVDPQVKPAYDPLAQTLSLTPVLELLPGNTLDFRGAKAVTPAVTRPAYGLDGGLRASAATGGGLSAQSYLGVAYFGGPLSAYAGLSGSLSSVPGTAGRSTSGSFGVRAIAHYDVNTDWGVSAAYRVDSDSVGGLGYGVGSFSGVSVTARGGLQRELSRVELDLPLEASVTVRVGERTLRQFRAAPGRLVLLNIPLENIVGTVEVNVTDSNGTRTFSSPYSFGGGTLQPGAFLITGRGGYLGDLFSGSAQRTLDLNARLGLPNNWSVQGGARLLEGNYAASVQGRHSSDIDSLGFGVTVGGYLTPGASGNRAAPDLRLNADYARQIGTLGLSATVSVPVLNVGASQVGVGVGYQAGRWNGSLSAGYDFGGQALSAALGAGYTLDDDRQLAGSLSGGYNFAQNLWNAGLSASYVPDSSKQFGAFINASSGSGSTPGRMQAGVGVRYTPNDQLSVDAGATFARTPVTDQATGAVSTVGSLGGTLAASYLIAPGQTVRAATDFNTLNASYEDARTLYTAANVSVGRTDGGLSGAASGEVRGAVTFLEGRAVLGQKLGQRAVVVRTGTPGIPLLLNGARVAVTDAAGEALLTGLPEGSISQVAVDLDALPFNITARDATADVSLAQSGVYILDWTHNFDVSRWVQLYWTPGEFSVYGVFTVLGQKYTLDDQGYVLIPDTGKAQRGTLSSDDGARTCELDIPAQGEKAVCPPMPLQNNVGQVAPAPAGQAAQPPAAQLPAAQLPAASPLPVSSQAPASDQAGLTDAQLAAQIAAGAPQLLVQPPAFVQPPADVGSPPEPTAPEAVQP
ncbi:hypothetical protein [Deinococcus sp.]|uniref:hypothetical protein n=1 Tax=Deinococcus sp. TaxID=47478 RepID=UPI003C79EDBF